MQCPYCKGEMEQGVIQSPQEISWQKKTYIWGRAKKHKGSIVLSDFSMIGSAIIAYHCQVCKKILIDYSEGTCDYNKMKKECRKKDTLEPGNELDK